jgi:tetratricopeptide (TPR) repeat protein
VENFLSRIENIFRSSASSDELFDAFREAINTRVTDIDLYKILLGNPSLSPDEIKMFAEKLAKEIPQQTSNTFMWTASVFEHQKDDYEKLEDAIKYYQKSFEYDTTNEIPLIRLLGLYNFDIETPTNKIILEFVDSRIAAVHFKSRVYFSVADIYKRKENYLIAAKYLALGEKAAERENNQINNSSRL